MEMKPTPREAAITEVVIERAVKAGCVRDDERDAVANMRAKLSTYRNSM
jgi:phosphoserine aminotransferase